MTRKLPHVMSASRSFVRSSNTDDEMSSSFRIAPITGQTALYDAVGEALRRLEPASRDKKVLIVMADRLSVHFL